ncbi:MAG: D-glycerate dehydrogenase, partial [Patescibacteria group bacterium]
MLKIFVTRRIPDIGIALLRKHKNFRVDVYREKDPAYDTAAPIPRGVLLKKVKDAHAILCMLTEKIDAELMDAAGSQLKIVANNAVGFDNIDIAEAKKRGIVVTNTPGVLIVYVAEHTIALILALGKRIV